MNTGTLHMIHLAFLNPIDSYSVAIAARTKGEAGMTAEKIEDIWAEEFKENPLAKTLGPRPRLGFANSEALTLLRLAYGEKAA